MVKQFAFLLLSVAVLSLSGCSSTKKATTTVSNTGSGVSAPAEGSYVGKWSFVVKGTPEGDTQGDMIISSAGNALKGLISTGGAQTEIQDLKITNNLLTGIFYYNGMAINMSGTFSGNAYDGKVEAQGYAFPMTATKAQ